MNIDDSFDKKLIINQVDNALIEKAKENEVTLGIKNKTRVQKVILKRDTIDKARLAIEF